MSGYNQQSNPFHQYNTRNKPTIPKRTDAFMPTSTNSNTTVSTFNPANYSHHKTTVTFSGPNNVPMFTTTYYNKN